MHLHLETTAHRKNGFTLLELAVVVLIIGLIISGVFVSKDLIRASQVREVIGEYDHYVKAVKEFQDQYQALPGDMNNATDIWGTDAGCPNTAVNKTVKTATCNGNGDGRIGSSDAAGHMTNTYEWYRAWQQLANAGFIEGKFVGAPARTTYNSLGRYAIAVDTIGLSVPASKVIPGGWLLFYYQQKNDNGALWGDPYGHLLLLTSFPIIDGVKFPFTGPVLTGSETFEIDSKIDDGNPSHGKMRTQIDGMCLSNIASKATAAYNTTTTTYGPTCAPFFILDF